MLNDGFGLLLTLDHSSGVQDSETSALVDHGDVLFDQRNFSSVAPSGHRNDDAIVGSVDVCIDSFFVEEFQEHYRQVNEEAAMMKIQETEEEEAEHRFCWTDHSTLQEVKDDLGLKSYKMKNPSNLVASDANRIMLRTLQFLGPFAGQKQWSSAFAQAAILYRSVNLDGAGKKNRHREVWHQLAKPCSEMVGSELYRAALPGPMNGLSAFVSKSFLGVEVLLAQSSADEHALILEQAVWVCAALGDSDPLGVMFPHPDVDGLQHFEEFFH
eukprot:TRINITY_DN3763_c0_g1_i2.p1 TRINITY_DN3763_c0_g1~~TRINITY_DN3763_c0_g1_i2.p1  ORF type:complete len:270 (-),score=56.47 TRINITY_DN3763_c0_g1_i2:164-973(-)